jgi:hypothetical protein
MRLVENSDGIFLGEREFMRMVKGGFVLAAVALCVLTLTAPRAQAGGLLGDTITIDYIYPNAGNVFESSGPLIVNPTASYAPFGNATATVSDVQIVFTAVDGTEYVPAAFNGFTITDTSRDPMISGVTVDAATSPDVGFTPNLISFTSDSVSVNLQSLSFTSTDNVTLDISFGSAVPEPSSMILAASAALCGLGGYTFRWHRRSKTIPPTTS